MNESPNFVVSGNFYDSPEDPENWTIFYFAIEKQYVLQKIKYLANLLFHLQKQTPRGVLRKRCSENMQQICKYVALQHGSSAVSLLHILRTPFYKNTSGELLLQLPHFLTLLRNCQYFRYGHYSLSSETQLKEI